VFHLFPFRQSVVRPCANERSYGFDSLLMGAALAGFIRWIASPRARGDKLLIWITVVSCPFRSYLGLDLTYQCLGFITALTETCLTWWVTIRDFGVNYGTFIQFYDFNCEYCYLQNMCKSFHAWS
jgi:hypothetical protein